MNSTDNKKLPDREFGACRHDFPVLDQEVNGKALVYLDNAATTHKPRAVIDAMSHFMENDNSNVHRGMGPLSRRATHAFEGARKKVADFIYAASPSEIVFTGGTTESINCVAQSWGRANLKKGDRILVGEWEHHSNLVPWSMVAETTGAELIPLPLNEDFSGPDPDVLRQTLRDPKTRLFAFTALSNSLGISLPVSELCHEAHAQQVVTVVDAAQAAAHLPINVQEWGCDFLAFSGHKCAGPTGIGVLFGKAELLENMPPFQGGGEMIDHVSFDRITFKPPPHRFEAGTPPIVEAVGLAAALQYLDELGRDSIARHDNELGSYALDRLQALDELDFLSPRPVVGPLISFNCRGIHAHDVADLAGEAGVALRAGHHCCQPLMHKCGIPGSLRASWFIYNTKEEIDIFCDTLRDILGFFRKSA